MPDQSSSWEDDKKWLNEVLGTSTPSPQPTSPSPQPTPPQVPGTLPPGIPTGQPYPTSVNLGKLRIVVPPPPAEIRRQLAVEQARTEIKARPKPLLATHTTALTQIDKAIQRLQNLIQFMEQKSFQTGPTSGRFYRGPVANAYMQFVGTPDEANFKAMNERFINDYITAQTGSQRGFKEMNWLATAVPNAAFDRPENYLLKAKTTLQELQDNRQQALDLLRDSNYDVAKVQQRQKQTQQESTFQGDAGDPYLAEARRRGLLKE